MLQCEQSLSRQLAEVQYLNKSLELERSNLASQNQSMQADLAQAYDKQHTLTKKVASSERQLLDASRYMCACGYVHTNIGCGQMTSNTVSCQHVAMKIYCETGF